MHRKCVLPLLLLLMIKTLLIGQQYKNAISRKDFTENAGSVLAKLSSNSSPFYRLKDANRPSLKDLLSIAAINRVNENPFGIKKPDRNKDELNQGFQFFKAFRFRYPIRLFNKKYIVETSEALSNWPVNSILADSVKTKKGKRGYYFCLEPGLPFM